MIDCSRCLRQVHHLFDHYLARLTTSHRVRSLAPPSTLSSLLFRTTPGCCLSLVSSAPPGVIHISSDLPQPVPSHRRPQPLVEAAQALAAETFGVDADASALKGFHPYRFVSPYHYDRKHRMMDLRPKKPALLGPSAADSRRRDIFYQLDIDPDKKARGDGPHVEKPAQSWQGYPKGKDDGHYSSIEQTLARPHTRAPEIIVTFFWQVCIAENTEAVGAPRTNTFFAQGPKTTSHAIGKSIAPCQSRLAAVKLKATSAMILRRDPSYLPIDRS
ncbi:hypothetical protein A0H81_09895 [Grifola frondosa]|uniref:Uncharacterized protein n=1 Tax=Grifola frondosa TaxID=5627 RepID=A0A1C7LZ48_GRIFR|nr:hypothetical protein A0H81_09895 [Grifola frondosa]